MSAMPVQLADAEGLIGVIIIAATIIAQLARATQRKSRTPQSPENAPLPPRTPVANDLREFLENLAGDTQQQQPRPVPPPPPVLRTTPRSPTPATAARPVVPPSQRTQQQAVRRSASDLKTPKRVVVPAVTIREPARPKRSRAATSADSVTATDPYRLPRSDENGWRTRMHMVNDLSDLAALRRTILLREVLGLPVSLSPPCKGMT